VSNSVNINWICYYFVTLNIVVHYLVNLRVDVYRPSSLSYSCVQCTACDCANIKT